MRLNKLSDNFIRKLAEISAGNLPSKIFEKLIQLIETEIKRHYFTHSSESNLIRIIEGMYDKIFFLSECVKYPHYAELLVSISSNSNYLSDILVIHPEYFYLVVNPSLLNKRKPKKLVAAEVKEQLNLFRSLETKVNTLNAIKRRELLRIGLQDIYSKFNLEDITTELSALASVLTSELFSLCYSETLNKYKIERTKGRYCIVSLGKLGGEELNYSSDIDLIVFFNKDYKLKPGKYFSEILSEALQLFLSKAGSGEAGFLYRIDFRLRPEGKNSPICRSINEYLNYYESRGDDWERQMLIKANFLCGSQNLYERFIKYLQAFIYPTSHTLSPLHQVKSLKDIMERNLTHNDIKRIPGGIRDIEFSLQALQLINGGIDKSLRTGNSLEAMSRLLKAIHLSDEEHVVLRNAYIFYRRIEHYLQLMNNKQTHTIPESGELLEKLSFYLGFNNVEKFKSEVENIRQSVKQIFDSIMGETVEKQTGSVNQINFSNRNAAENDLKYLREGKGLISTKQFDATTIAAFKKIEAILPEYLKQSRIPDQVLSNFVRIIRNADFPSIWYKEFFDEKFFYYFLIICEYSQRSVDLFAENKELRECFLSREFLRKTVDKTLVTFTVNKILFIYSAQLILDLISPLEVSKTLSKVIIEKIRNISANFSEDKNWGNKYFVAALGSTGSSEMTFGSDIDLVFAVKNIAEHPGAQKDFQDLLKILKEELKPFPVDCRLRPEGESSQLVWDIENYKEYYNSRARVWEFQSYLKFTFVAGKRDLYNILKRSVIKKIGDFKSKELRDEITGMRKQVSKGIPSELNMFNLKRGSGGLIDIEYVTNFLILRNPDLVKKCIGKSIVQNLELLIKERSSYKILKKIMDNYKFLKEIEFYKQLVFASNSSMLSIEKKDLVLISDLLKFRSTNDFINRLELCKTSNRKVYNKFLKLNK